MRPNKGVLMRTCAGCNSFFDVARGNFYLIYPDAPDKTKQKITYSCDCALKILVKDGLVKRM